MSQLTVWCVVGGYFYEGESASSARVFYREEDARSYGELLVRSRSASVDDDCGYDYYEVSEQVVR